MILLCTKLNVEIDAALGAQRSVTTNGNSIILAKTSQRFLLEIGVNFYLHIGRSNASVFDDFCNLSIVEIC